MWPQSYASSSSKIKRKENQKKRNIKSKKIDKRKRKMFSIQAHHNTGIDFLISSTDILDFLTL